MEITVCKFGGSSLSDERAFGKVLSVLENSKERRYIVVSAPGKRFKGDEKVTDLLLQAYALLEKDDENGFSKSFGLVCERFESFSPFVGRAFVSRELAALKTRIVRNKDRAFCASRGEYLTAKIVAKTLEVPFVDTEDLLFIGAGGKVVPRTYETIDARLKKEPRAVLPGFYGTGEKGICTFPRGGGDISGGVIARAVSAQVYENWTDVSGFFACDPEAVKDPEKIDELSYFELRALFEAGAKVLHGDAVLPLEEAEIPVVIRNTFDENGGYTTVKRTANRKGIAGVAVKKTGRFAEITAVDERSAGKDLSDRMAESLKTEGLSVVRIGYGKGRGRCRVRAEEWRSALGAVYREFF